MLLSFFNSSGEKRTETHPLVKSGVYNWSTFPLLAWIIIFLFYTSPKVIIIRISRQRNILVIFMTFVEYHIVMMSPSCPTKSKSIGEVWWENHSSIRQACWKFSRPNLWNLVQIFVYNINSKMYHVCLLFWSLSAFYKFKTIKIYNNKQFTYVSIFVLARSFRDLVLDF